MHNCSQCMYSTPRKSNLQRHLQTRHKERVGTQQNGMSNHGYQTGLFPPRHHQANQLISNQDNCDYLKESQLSHGKQHQYEEAMKNLETYYKDHIQKLKEALQCQQHEHDQELKNRHCQHQQLHNNFVENLHKQHQMEKENLCREYQKCIDQTRLQFQKYLENKIGNICKEYQDCINQTGLHYQRALESKQNQYNKMKDFKDDLEDCIDEYHQAQEKSKGKYCCQVCGAGMKTYLKLLIHMKIHK